MIMELYLLKSTVILAILYVFYKLVLENTSIHNFKRFYLLGSLVTSFVIPFITFTSYGQVSAFQTIYTEGIPKLTVDKTIETINYWPLVLWTIYGLGVLFFSVKFLRNLFTIIQQIRKNPKRQDRSFTNILLKENVIPHTFFSYIFLNKEKFESGNIPAEVLLHEEAHARQRHSLDIILIELLKIIFWFNPLFYFLKRSIKLNHEFLADEAVLKNGFETSAYQKLLLAFINPNNQSHTITPRLAHSINYSPMKKRFLIMKTNTSRRSILFRSLLILPLLSFLIYGFGSTETIKTGHENSYVSTNDLIEDIQIEIDENSKIYLNGKRVALSNLKNELNKLNKSLTVEEKQKYLSARIELENENNLNIAKEIENILHSCNVRSMSVGILKNERDAGLKHIRQINPMAGKTVEEAEGLYQQYLIDVENFTKANANAEKDENNPWSIEVQKNEDSPRTIEVQKDENNPWSIEVQEDGDNPQSIEVQKDESNPWSIKVQKDAASKDIIDEWRKQE
ncbi:M56 family metallopeptidase [Aequorivita sp. H23M31]|uniref:M56 family metallopeptidase n=1 Tax=Aequorivita ciconiae TaxID=2494375 RepID=A0A410G5V4_9FLAO|nr:M56 family metallopeptidase [Aequorivita sp. H23M31]QAA82611.1 M56 family metallopeptidase [Aequorivita sp. H23M31]